MKQVFRDSRTLEFEAAHGNSPRVWAFLAIVRVQVFAPEIGTDADFLPALIRLESSVRQQDVSTDVEVTWEIQDSYFGNDARLIRRAIEVLDAVDLDGMKDDFISKQPAMYL